MVDSSSLRWQLTVSSSCVRWRQFCQCASGTRISMLSTASVHNFQVLVQEDQRGTSSRVSATGFHRQPMASDVFVAGNRLEKNFDRSEDAVRQRCRAIIKSDDSLSKLLSNDASM
jgi:hypothetical protein